MLDPLVAEKYGHLPFVVSPGGTDINLHVMKGEGMKIVGKTCRMARYIIAQSPEIACLLQELLPDLQERIAAVPKSFLWLGKDDFDLRAVAGCREEDVLFFMPAGIRPVKGNLECLCSMEKAWKASPEIRVVFAGPALDARYAARFEKVIKGLDSFARWIFQIPPQAMRAAYEGADVVLNHSNSEGLSNSLLEAMAAGRPVLASDIPGNRWLVEDKNGIGPCGCLFDPGDQADFVRSVLRLARDPAYREFLAANGRLRAAAWPQPADEAHALLGIYEAAIGRR
jgi:glycosyltransferase involved in cell wall biosynthesis